MLRRAMVYLGLVDDDYDDYEPYDDPAPMMAPTRAARPAGAEALESHQGGVIRTLPRDPAGGLRPLEDPTMGVTLQPNRGGSVRPITPSQSAKVHVVVVQQFNNDAQEVGERLKGGQPVIVNVQSVDRDLRRRLVDFCSGLTFGLGGKMKQVADAVYLLTPSNVEVSDEEKRRLQERGLYRS
ncbi:MAG TPA: cell division protein SepF [Acidimicrobiales bacterium]|nr:cell division protein SepF [Acidimicrobiales bacterium]